VLLAGSRSGQLSSSVRARKSIRSNAYARYSSYRTTYPARFKARMFRQVFFKRGAIGNDAGGIHECVSRVLLVPLWRIIQCVGAYFLAVNVAGRIDCMQNRLLSPTSWPSSVSVNMVRWAPCCAPRCECMLYALRSLESAKVEPFKCEIMVVRARLIQMHQKKPFARTTLGRRTLPGS